MSDTPAELERSSARSRRASELERTLGLPQAFALGTGTMVGADIFVFPGRAVGRVLTGDHFAGAFVPGAAAVPAPALRTQPRRWRSS